MSTAVLQLIGEVIVALLGFALALSLIVVCFSLIDKAIYRIGSVLGFAAMLRDFYLVRCWMEDKGIGNPLLYRRLIHSEDYGFRLLSRSEPGQPGQVHGLTDRQWETWCQAAYAYEKRQREKATDAEDQGE